jgi:hypothetical protein
MPFDHLLFVSDAGNGDLFGYAVLNGVVRKTDPRRRGATEGSRAISDCRRITLAGGMTVGGRPTVPSLHG